MSKEDVKLCTSGDVTNNKATYLSRPADKALLEACESGQFSYVLACRQIGKSSLKSAVSNELEKKGHMVSCIDLNTFGQVNVERERWYQSLQEQIAADLGLKADYLRWKKKLPMGSTLIWDFSKFFRDFVLKKIRKKVVIFIDEIDVTLNLPFGDDFFAAIRALDQDRGKLPDLKRLNFVVLGVATPDELINDNSRTPFNIGRRIDLNDFTIDECEILHKAIEKKHPKKGQLYFNQIYGWTNGHPYLTQKLCAELIKKHPSDDPSLIDNLVKEIFISEVEHLDVNIQFVQDRVTSDPHKTSMLKLYRNSIESDSVWDDKQSVAMTRLKLYGIVATKNGKIKNRNRIYHKVFDVNWVLRHMPMTFTDGGFLNEKASSYINRPEDKDLVDALKSDHFCHVYASRFMGVTSLMIRTARRMRPFGVRTVNVNLRTIDATDIENLYLELARTIISKLQISVDLDSWWKKQKKMNKSHPFISLFFNLILKKINGKLVLFLDDIEIVNDIDNFENFFHLIHQIHDKNMKVKKTNSSIVIVTLGKTPLFRMTRNIAAETRSIFKEFVLKNFTEKEVEKLSHGFEDFYPDKKKTYLFLIYDFTGGHPYLTQKLCQSMINRTKGWNHDEMKKYIEVQFFSLLAEQKHDKEFLQIARNIFFEKITSRGMRINLSASTPMYGNDIILLTGSGASSYLGLSTVEQLLSIIESSFLNIIQEKVDHKQYWELIGKFHKELQQIENESAKELETNLRELFKPKRMKSSKSFNTVTEILKQINSYQSAQEICDAIFYNIKRNNPKLVNTLIKYKELFKQSTLHEMIEQYNQTGKLVIDTYKEIGGRQGQKTIGHFGLLIARLRSYLSVAKMLREDTVIRSEFDRQSYYLSTKNFENKLILALEACYRVLIKELGPGKSKNMMPDEGNTSHEFRKSLEFFEQLAEINSHILHIYTMNYDCSYHDFSSYKNRNSSLTFLSHIDKTNHIFDEKYWHFIDEDNRNRIYIHRLNGCVSWFNEENGNTREEPLKENLMQIETDKLINMCINYNPSQISSVNKAFQSAFSEFKDHLKVNKALLIWGFSFRNFKVLSEINNALNNRDKHFPIYYINPFVNEETIMSNIKNTIGKSGVSEFFRPKQIDIKPQHFNNDLIEKTKEFMDKL